MKFREYKKIDNTCRTRWSGQGYINKLIIISVVMYILKQSGIVGVGISKTEINSLYPLLYCTGCGIEQCRSWQSQVNKLKFR